jgi:hypothetical protein
LILAWFSAFSVWAQDSKPFKAEEPDQVLAPIALHPVVLLSQVLMASTYPAYKER